MPGVRKLPAGSYSTGPLPKGCTLCEKGTKLVLLITGLCAQNCWYCPLSEKKKGKDVIFANERPVTTVEEVLEEANAMDALGTGVTGGDPLEVAERTAEHIRALKAEFGTKHHIHLYTPSTDRDRIALVRDAGLDELRLHPPPHLWNDDGLAPYRETVREFADSMVVGFEVPALVDSKGGLERVASLADSAGAAFLNVNELEYSPTNLATFQQMGLTPEDDFCTAVKGSSEAARLLKRLNLDMPVHFCSAPFKDAVQLRNRLVRRGEIVARDFEVLTRDGTLVLGIVEEVGHDETAKAMSDAGIPKDSFEWNDSLKRIELDAERLEKAWTHIPFPSAIVEEYASWDRLEIERRPLRAKK